MENVFMGWQHEVSYNKMDKIRIWLMWLPQEFQVQVIHVTTQAIHSKARHCHSNDGFLLIVMYGDNDNIRRKDLWHYLSFVGCAVT